MTSRPRIVLTGFEPFDGAHTNPSWDAVQIATRILEHDGHKLVVERIPVEFVVGPGRIAQLVAEYAPQVFIATGVAAKSNRIRLERRAANEIDATIPDNIGHQPRGVPVRPNSLGAYATTLPTTLTMNWNAAAIPWEFSDDAGRYVCNAAFYTLQHVAIEASRTTGAAMATGFIHVPPSDVVSVNVSGRAIAIAAASALTDVSSTDVFGTQSRGPDRLAA